MVEEMTFGDILQRMLDRIPDSYDKREGSVIYTALAPAAVELQLMYLELDRVRRESFADTASREYLVRRCAERGIVPYQATNALRRGTFNIDVPMGSRFSLGEHNYRVVERVSEGVFTLECETPGEAGNRDSGALVPIQYIEGLQTASLQEIVIPGEEEEDTEALRSRFFASLESQAFGGNIADYQEKVNALDGVGGVKVTPVWAGPGTVKLTIIASDHSVPSRDLVERVQEAMDPEENGGAGVGIAPIGHRVTVEAVRPVPIEVSAKFTYQPSWDYNSVKPYLEKVLETYFRELARSWSGTDQLIVRISQVETRLLSVDGILDISDTTLNGVAQNLALEEDQVPKLGGNQNGT